MEKRSRSAGAAIMMAIALTLMATTAGFATEPPVIEDCIPVGSEIRSAVLSLQVSAPSDAIVGIYRVTAPWDENVVTWNSFAESYDPTMLASFTPATTGLHSVDVTSIVQAWVDGTYENYGLKLDQEGNVFTAYVSSERSVVEWRPKLEVCFAVDSTVECVIIQRPSVVQDGVADTYVWEARPDTNNGYKIALYSGILNGFKKQTLLWFDICEDDDCIAALTPGFWKTHPEAWPVDGLALGDQDYTMVELMMILWRPVRGDASIILGNHLIATKLNLLSGTTTGIIEDRVADADALLSGFGSKLPYRVRARTALGAQMIITAYWLDQYNNNFLTNGCVEPDGD